MIKNYYRLKKAAKLLSAELGQEIDRFDLFELAARGEINLCAEFSGDVAEFKFNHPEPISAGFWRFRLNKALIKIHSNDIKLGGGIVRITNIEPVEIIVNNDHKTPHPFYGGGCESLPRIKAGYFFGTFAADHENAGKIKFVALEVDSDQAVVSTKDLLCFVEKNKSTEQSDTQETKTPEITSSSIPGKIPRVAIGKLAIKAAWEIEREHKSKRRATADEVMKRLQSWADAGTHPDVLLGSNRRLKQVTWLKSKSGDKPFSIGACEKALKAWNESRDNSNLSRI